jgi:zinc protease
VCALGSAARAEDFPSTLQMRDMAFPVRVFNTPSGLRIIFEEDHSRPMVSVVTIIDAGSAFDPVGKEGLAHVVEHLTFRARPDGKTTVTELYRRSGLGDWNATTTHDLVMFWCVGARESLGDMLTVEGTRILAPLLGVDATTLDSERGVVRNEVLQRDEGGRATAVESRLYGQLYPSGHPYARGVGGTEQTLAAIQLADAQAFVKAHYQPANATMVISGDVDPKAIGKIMDTSLPRVFLADPPAGTLPPAPRLSSPAPTVPKLAPAPALERVRGPVDGPTLYLGWSLPRGFDSEAYLQLYVQQLLDGQAIWATVSDVDIVGLDSQLEQGKTGSTLVVAVSLRDGSHPERSAEKVLDQLVGLWMPGGNEVAIHNDEVAFSRIRAQTLVEIAGGAENLSARASARALVSHYLGDPQYLGRQLPAIAQLTVPQLSRFAYEWLSRDRARMVFVEPGGGSARGEGGSNGVFAPSGGSRFVVPPDVLRQRVHPPGLQIRSGKLKNGLEVVVARRPSAPLVSVTLASRGGDSTGEPLGAGELAQIAQQQRYDHGAPSKVGASRRGWRSRDAGYMQFNAASGNLANAVAFVSDRVRWLHVDAGNSPRMLTEELETFRVLSLRSTAQAERSLWAEALKGSPSARQATSADLGKIGSGDVQDFIDRTLLPGSSVLVIAGDVDLDQAMQRAKDYLEDWSPRANRPGALEGVPPPQDGPVRVVRTARPGARQTELRLGCSIAIEKPEDDVASEMLLSRLGGRLESLARGSLAASYGFDIRRTRHRGFDVLDLQGLVDSAGVNRVLGVLLKEAEGLASYQVPEEDLGRLRWSLGGEFNVSLQRTRTVSSTLATLRTSDRPLDVINRYPELLAGTTAADVARVAARCRKTAVVSLLGDEKTVAEALKAAGR